MWSVVAGRLTGSHRGDRNGPPRYGRRQWTLRMSLGVRLRRDYRRWVPHSAAAAPIESLGIVLIPHLRIRHAIWTGAQRGDRRLGKRSSGGALNPTVFARYKRVSRVAAALRSLSAERRSLRGDSSSDSIGSRRALGHRDDSIEMLSFIIVQQADHAEHGDPRDRPNDRGEGPTTSRNPRPNFNDDAKAIGHSTKKAAVRVGHLTVRVVRKLFVRIRIEREAPLSRPLEGLAPFTHRPFGAFRYIRGQPEPELAVLPNAKPSESNPPQLDSANHGGVLGVRPAQKVTKLKGDAKIGTAPAATHMEKGHGRSQTLPQEQPRAGMVARNVAIEDQLPRDAGHRSVRVAGENAMIPREPGDVSGDGIGNSRIHCRNPNGGREVAHRVDRQKARPGLLSAAHQQRRGTRCGPVNTRRKKRIKIRGPLRENARVHHRE